MSDPLHGITLKSVVEALVARHGWDELGQRVPIRCFLHDPSLSSSLKFLRRTPWARAKVEALYRDDLREDARRQAREQRRAARRAARAASGVSEAFAATMPRERPDTLALRWPFGAPPPEARATPGVALRRGIDRDAFCAVQDRIGFVVTDAVWSEVRLVDGGMVVARDAQGPVAVACAEARAGGWVELGWVAVDPSHRGQGLGRAVCSALVTALLEGGHTLLFGSTQDARVHALRIYLDLGFAPVERPDKAARWAAVIAQTVTAG